MELDRGTLLIGVDLAWAEGSAARVGNKSGVMCIDGTGQSIDELAKVLKSPEVRRVKPWKVAKKLVRNAPEGLVPQHTAFLPGLPSESW